LGDDCNQRAELQRMTGANGLQHGVDLSLATMVTQIGVERNALDQQGREHIGEDRFIVSARNAKLGASGNDAAGKLAQA